METIKEQSKEAEGSSYANYPKLIHEVDEDLDFLLEHEP